MNNDLDLIPVSDWGCFTFPGHIVIAGPCSAETEEQVMATAYGLKELGIDVFRAGIWKPRTHPGCFEGSGVVGLKWLQRVKRELGMKVCTEVAGEKHVAECIKFGVDMLWIGARTSANPFLVQEIADALHNTDIPVFVKNPVSPDVDLWSGALERLNRAGVRKLGVIHRGFFSSKKMPYRNDPDWKIAIEMKTRYPEIPFLADPSHIAGDSKYLLELSQRALDLGLDGLMIESHNHPECALSDAGQQITPSQLKDLLQVLTFRKKDTDAPGYKEVIGQLRTQIDIIDENLISLLNSRMELSRKIGEYKKEHNIAIIQTSRWDDILSDMIEKGKYYGLSEKFVESLFNIIHEESVRTQNEIPSSGSSE